MGNDLVAYRARIGNFHCIKKQYKKGEFQINFSVSRGEGCVCSVSKKCVCGIQISKLSMGNDLVAYRARIGAYNCMKRCNKKGEINATFGVSKWIIFQILTLLLLTAGIESNPGPISQTHSSIERAEEQLNHLRDLILKMKDKQQINSEKIFTKTRELTTSKRVTEEKS